MDTPARPKRELKPNPKYLHEPGSQESAAGARSRGRGTSSRTVSQSSQAMDGEESEEVDDMSEEEGHVPSTSQVGGGQDPDEDLEEEAQAALELGAAGQGEYEQVDAGKTSIPLNNHAHEITHEFAPEAKMQDPGEYLHEQAMHDVHGVLLVKKNLEWICDEEGVLPGDDAIAKSFVALATPVVDYVLGEFKKPFLEARKCALNASTVAAFLLTLHLICAYETTFTLFYDDANAGLAPGAGPRMFPHYPHECSREDFVVLWGLLNDHEPREPATIAPRRDTGTTFTKKLFSVICDSLSRLCKGAKKVYLTVDDLLIQARSSTMQDAGYLFSMNKLKAANAGLTLDVGAFGFLRIPVLIVYRDSLDRTEGRSLASMTYSAICMLCQSAKLLHSQVTVFLDRGYEGLASFVVEGGFRLIATSQRGSRAKPWLAFTFDLPNSPARQLSAALQGKVMLVSCGALKSLTVRWVEKRLHGVPVYHLCLTNNRNAAPTLMKTTEKSLVNRVMLAPKTKADARALGICASLNGDGDDDNDPAPPNPVTAASFSTNPVIVDVSPLPLPAGPVTTFEELGSNGNDFLRRALTKNLDKHVNERFVFLSAHQRSPTWFLARVGISSTALIEVLRFFSDASCFVASYALPMPGSLEHLRDVVVDLEKELNFAKHKRRHDLSLSLSPARLAASSSRCSSAAATTSTSATAQPGVSFFGETHLLFLCQFTEYELSSLPKHLLCLQDTAVEDLSEEQMLTVCDWPKRKPSPPQEELRAKVREKVEAFRMKCHPDLPSRVETRLGSTFKGNESTLAGQVAEENLSTALPDLLPSVAFVDENGDACDSPFQIVSLVGSGGCCARMKESLCVASTDGFFSAVDTRDFDPTDTIQDISSRANHWVLEVKTVTARESHAKAKRVSDNVLLRVDAISPPEVWSQLQELLLSREHGLQVLHHCASTGIPRALYAIVDGYELKGVLRYVAIEFDESILTRHVDFVERVVDIFLPYMKATTDRSYAGIPAYDLNYRRSLREGVIDLVVQAKESRILPLVTRMYNDAKSAVDVAHRVLASYPSSQGGQRRKVVIAGLGLLMVGIKQAYRGLVLGARDLSHVHSRAQLETQLHAIPGDKELAFKLASINPEVYFKAARAEAKRKESVTVDNPHWRPNDPGFLEEVSKRMSSLGAERSTAEDLASCCDAIVAKFYRDDFFKAIRTNTHPAIQHVSVTVTDTGKEKDARTRCMLCCEVCAQGKECKGRKGAKTSKKCPVCHVMLCNQRRKAWGGLSCHEFFHLDRPLYKHGETPGLAMGSTTTAVAAATTTGVATTSTSQSATLAPEDAGTASVKKPTRSIRYTATPSAMKPSKRVRHTALEADLPSDEVSDAGEGRRLNFSSNKLSGMKKKD
jgi:hypothetical protein